MLIAKAPSPAAKPDTPPCRSPMFSSFGSWSASGSSNWISSSSITRLRYVFLQNGLYAPVVRWRCKAHIIDPLTFVSPRLGLMVNKRFDRYLQVLQLSSRRPRLSDIKRALKRQQLRWHPDKNVGRDTRARWALVQEARDYFLDLYAAQKKRDANPSRKKSTSDAHVVGYLQFASHRHYLVHRALQAAASVTSRIEARIIEHALFREYSWRGIRRPTSMHRLKDMEVTSRLCEVVNTYDDLSPNVYDAVAVKCKGCQRYVGCIFSNAKVPCGQCAPASLEAKADGDEHLAQPATKQRSLRHHRTLPDVVISLTPMNRTMYENEVLQTFRGRSGDVILASILDSLTKVAEQSQDKCLGSEGVTLYRDATRRHCKLVDGFLVYQLISTVDIDRRKAKTHDTYASVVCQLMSTIPDDLVLKNAEGYALLRDSCGQCSTCGKDIVRRINTYWCDGYVRRQCKQCTK